MVPFFVDELQLGGRQKRFFHELPEASITEDVGGKGRPVRWKKKKKRFFGMMFDVF